MVSIVVYNCFCIIVGITVLAQVKAGIVHANVISKKAGAGSSGVLDLGEVQLGVESFFVDGLGHAAAAVCSKLGKLCSFAAGAKGHAMVFCYPGHMLPEVQAVSLFKGSSFGEILFYLLVYIYKTDYSCLGIAIKG